MPTACRLSQTLGLAERAIWSFVTLQEPSRDKIAYGV